MYKIIDVSINFSKTCFSQFGHFLADRTIAYLK